MADRLLDYAPAGVLLAVAVWLIATGDPLAGLTLAAVALTLAEIVGVRRRLDRETDRA